MSSFFRAVTSANLVAIHTVQVFPTYSNISNQFENDFEARILEFWFGVDFDPSNLSVAKDKIFLHKYHSSCVAEFRQTGLSERSRKEAMFQLHLIQKFNDYWDNKTQQYQPNFIVLLSNEISLQSQKHYITVPLNTRAIIMLVSIATSKIYLSCTICGDTTEFIVETPVLGLLITQPTMLEFPDEISTIKRHTDLININNNNMRKANRFAKEKEVPSKMIRCPVENKSRHGVYYLYDAWLKCAKELIRIKLNCTTNSCDRALVDIRKMHRLSIKPFHYTVTYGIEFYGITYSLFYNPAKDRNMFALLSPFTAIGWFIVVVSGYFVGLVLWLSKPGLNMFFWLLSVIIEQGDSLKSELNKRNVIVVISWIYGALILRQAYTSNLFSYMTFESSIPADLPKTFEQMLESESVKMFANNFINTFLILFQNTAETEKSVTQTTSYKFTDKALAKMWRMDTNSGALKNVRTNSYGNYEICNLKFKVKQMYKIDPDSCREYSSYAVLYKTGPVDLYQTVSLFTTK